MTYRDVLNFWFNEIPSENWFKKDEAFDEDIRRRFGSLHARAVQGELFEWRATIEGRLAEIIVLDQFSRNMYREDLRAFQYDGMALVLAQEAVQAKDAENLPVEQRAFLYMPFTHSESLKIHDLAMTYFDQPGLEYSFEYEKKHRAIIKRFGRYPHRNDILGRISTPEERAFLTQPGSSF